MTLYFFPSDWGALKCWDWVLKRALTVKPYDLHPELTQWVFVQWHEA